MANPADSLSISTRSLGPSVVVDLQGELDLHAVGELDSTVGRLLDDRPAAIEVDATSLTFIDSCGLRALLVARHAADAAGVQFRIAKSSAPLDRILGMTGLRQILGAGAD